MVGEDCETFALRFKDFKLGQAIGTRACGGWVGIRGDKPLRDGGKITQPEVGGWDTKSSAWIIEGQGVDARMGSFMVTIFNSTTLLTT